MGKTVRAHLYISGEVQGVGFRAFVQRVSMKGGLAGWVRNLDDGRVEAILEGEEGAVQEAMARVKKGPPFSRVQKCEVSWESPDGGFGGLFEVRG
ncbi:MAG: acylphosphatase [Euryarchaeota archaeon]|nr:acylphosphatase [Euryarchaeota archaeon]